MLEFDFSKKKIIKRIQKMNCLIPWRNDDIDKRQRYANISICDYYFLKLNGTLLTQALISLK